MSNDNGTSAVQRRGLMLVLSSPSGAGKTTLSRQLLDNDKQIQLSVSCTTRARKSAASPQPEARTTSTPSGLIRSVNISIRRLVRAASTGVTVTIMARDAFRN